MWLDIDVNGIRIQFRLKGYKKSSQECWDSEWCKSDFAFTASSWLDYHKDDDEVFLCCEIEELLELLTNLLEDRITEVKKFECIEPDFKFVLYPKEDLRNNSKYTYVRPGCEIQDIYLEWKIFFWDGGLTDNFLTVTLGRTEIEEFRNYLSAVVKR